MALEYILELKSTYVQRSLSWLAVYAHQRLAFYELMLLDFPKGKEFQASIAKDKWVHDLPPLPQDKVQAAIVNMRNLLSRDQFCDLSRKNTFNSAGHLIGISCSETHQPAAVGLRPEPSCSVRFPLPPMVRYRPRARFLNFPGCLIHSESGIRGIRDAGALQDLSWFAATFMVEATRRMLLEFRPGEGFR